MKTEFAWIVDYKNKIANFLTQMQIDDYRHWRYSYSGDFWPANEWGLANAVFAIKILYINDLLKTLEPKQINNLYQKIISFQHQDFLTDPYIVDRDQIIKNLFNTKKKTSQLETKTAETRQAFAALYLLNKKPLKPFRHLPMTQKKISQFLEKFDWSFPWHAGSHFSHLLFFLYMNHYFFAHQNGEYQNLIKHSLNWIEKIQSKDDGMWYQQDCNLTQKINGAMKIATGYHAVKNYDLPYAKKIIDTALLGINDQEACSNFNIVYVLYAGNKVEPDYRKAEIEDFLLQRLAIYKEYYYSKYGAFSFKKGQANDTFYGKKITQGKNEPDIHGTIMFTWGLAIINQVLNLGFDFQIPVN